MVSTIIDLEIEQCLELWAQFPRPTSQQHTISVPQTRQGKSLRGRLINRELEIAEPKLQDTQK